MIDYTEKDKENIKLIEKFAEVEHLGFNKYKIVFDYKTIYYNQIKNTITFVDNGKTIGKAWKYIRRNIIKNE